MNFTRKIFLVVEFLQLSIHTNIDDSAVEEDDIGWVVG